MVGPVPLRNLATHCSITVACVLSQGPFQRVTGLIVFSFVDSYLKFNIDIEQTGATKGLDCTLRTQPDVSHQSKILDKIPKAGSIWRTACSPEPPSNWRVGENSGKKKCPNSHQSRFRIREGLLLRVCPNWRVL